MRKLPICILSIFLVFSFSECTYSAESATGQGSVMLGGALSFSSVDSEGAKDKLNTLILAPNAMVFLIEGFAIGPEIYFVHQSEGDVAVASHRYIGKLLYIAPTEHPLRPFIEGGFGFIRQSYDYNSNSGGIGSENGWTLKLGIGMYAFLNQHYAIVASFNYFHDNFMVSQGNEWKYNTVSLSVGFTGFVF